MRCAALPEERIKKPKGNPLLNAFVETCQFTGHAVSAEHVLNQLDIPTGLFEDEHILLAAQKLRLNFSPLKQKINKFTTEQLPALLILKNGQAAVLKQLYPNGTADILSGSRKHENLKLDELQNKYTGKAYIVEELSKKEKTLQKPEVARQNWFWGTLRTYLPNYGHIALSAILINLMALVTPLFIMNVYDRVVPNQAIETLWVLSSGVIVAFIFEFILKNLKSYFVDHTGSRVDIETSAMIFRQILNTRLKNRPESSGAFANHLKEFESLRQFYTSFLITLLIDVPFVFFFVMIIYMIGGAIIWPIVIALPLIMMVSYIIQKPLTWMVKEHMKVGNNKHALLIESLRSLESVKTTNAQDTFINKWLEASYEHAKASQQTKAVSASAINFAQFAQHIVTISVIILGVHLIHEKELSVGALVACTILTGRTLAPVSRFAGLLTHYYRASSSLKTFDQLMKAEIEKPEGKTFLGGNSIEGDFEFKDVRFHYPREKLPVIKNLQLNIKAGEKVAIVGRTGSGKSTLLQMLLGLYTPDVGMIKVDGIEISQVDPETIRSSIGYMPQESQLFTGTLRDNITMGYEDITDEHFLNVVEKVGLNELANNHPNGFDMKVGEEGHNLSGGQRQAIMMARALIHEPNILILDEPTSSMDNHTESMIINALKPYIQKKTFIVCTHRMSMLALVDRVIVMDGGTIIADGKKEDVLTSLSKGAV